MTIVAGVATGDVRGVLARGGLTIVAGGARANDLRVINSEHGYPDVRRVAILANITRLYVCQGLAGRIRAVMAAGAISHDVDVIEIRRQPARRRMAIVAAITAVDMVQVLAYCDDTVVAGSAGTNYLRVIDRVNRIPDIRRMAIFADVAGLNVCLILAGRLGTVVAAETVARNVDVIEIRGHPAGCRMTVIAVVTAGDVREVFTRCRQAIVTGATGADDLRVVNGVCRCPDIAVVAVFTNIGCLYVRQRFAVGFDTIVAAGTVPKDVDMVKIGGSPRVCGMAIIASVTAFNMPRVFTSGYDAVVARAAGTNNLYVVDGEYGREHIRVVAIFANIACLNMGRGLAGRFNSIVAINTGSGDVDVIEVRG